MDSVLFVHLIGLEGDKAERYLLGWEQILRKLEGNVAVALVFYQYVLGINSDAPVAQLVEHRAVTREVCEFDSGRTNTQGLKITEEQVLPF